MICAGVSLSVVLSTIVGLKNKDALTELWNSLKIKVEKGSMFSTKWFDKSSVEEINAARDLVQLDLNNPDLDLDYRDECRRLLGVIDNALYKKQDRGEAVGFPVHTPHGWYLPSDDD